MARDTTKGKGEAEINLFRAIEVFMAVAEMRQVTAAASALGITQSAASQHLKNLETAFGLPLFDRTTRPIQLTHAGAILQRHGFRLLNLIDMRREMRHLGAGSLPALRLGLLASIATTLTPALYELVGRRLGVPELVLTAGLANEHYAALNERRLDMAITSEHPPAGAGYLSLPLMDEPFLLALPQDYDGPLDDIHAIAARLSLARFATTTPVGRRIEQHLQRCRLDLPRAIEADRTAMVVAGVTTGRCFAIISPMLLIDGVAEGMALRLAPLPFPLLRRTIRLVCRRDDLGDIPLRIARESQRILRDSFARHLPQLAGKVTYHEIADPLH